MAQQVQVLIPHKISKPFDYIWPHASHLNTGQIVIVPLRNTTCVGLVISCQRQALKTPLKSIIAALSIPQLTHEFMEFLTWMSRYTMTPLGTACKMVFGSTFAGRLTSKSRIQRLSWGDSLDFFPPSPPLLKELVAQWPACQDPDHVVHLLFLSGHLTSVGKNAPAVYQPPPHAPQPPPAGYILNDDQKHAAQAMCQSIDACGHKKTFLLDGVTGSGKTEVYFEAVRHVLLKKGQALVLLPEITLTHQWLKRFHAHSGITALTWHCAVPSGQKRLIWHRVIRGEPLVVVGTRSALFLPFSRLHLMVVDEEHDSNYKQEEGGSLYHARDMAVARSRGSITTVLASATPSLETLQNVACNKYHRLPLPQRAHGAPLPNVQVVDMKIMEKKPHEWLSPPLIQALQDNHKAGNLSMVFLNRRGYAPLLICRSCGYRFQCPHCSVWLSYHAHHQLLCHHCGHRMPLSQCPSCHKTQALSPCGPGVERIAQELQRKCPQLRCQLITSDHMQKPQAMENVLKVLEKREVDVLLGTQILAKGHDFASLTMVGIVDADMGLVGGDPRAQERSFQLLHQVAGRAGRRTVQGTVYVQTHEPNSPLIQALVAQDRQQLMACEIAGRKLVNMPPFGRLAAVIIASKRQEAAEQAARAMAKHCPANMYDHVEVLGPVPAPLYKRRDWYRWRFLVKSSAGVLCQPFLQHWHAQFAFPHYIKVTIDIDPQTFL